MNYYLIVIVFILNFQNFGPLDLHSQDLHRGTADYEIIYSYSIEKYKPKEGINVSPGFMEDAAAARKIISNLKGRLIFDSKSAIYWSPESLAEKDHADALANMLVRADHKYFYFNPENILFVEKINFGKRSQFVDDKTIVWEVLPDETIINGLKARKASGSLKRKGWSDTKVEAWFAPDIPFPFGPVATHGLPGVILEYKMGSLTITAHSIKKITDQGEEIVIPDFGDVPSLSESVR